MNSNKSTARLVGLVYLMLVASGVFSLQYVPSQLMVSDNPAATFQNLVSHESLFRWGIFVEVISELIFLSMAFLLYKLLSPVNRNAALIMVSLVCMGVVLALISLSHKFSVLTIIEKPNLFASMTPEEIHFLATTHLKNYSNGIGISTIFWGLWLFPFGYLVYHSNFLPKILGVLLMIGCFGYLVNFSMDLVVENYSSWNIENYVIMPASISELAICLWMLIMGAKDRPTQ